jgi:type IV pilus assembly protein PilQ
MEHPVFGASATGATTQIATSSNTLLSPRGQVTVDSRTNSLLIQDTAGKIREVRKLISQLDQPVRQVMIESRLVEATDNFSKSLGSRFGVKYSDVSPSGRSGAGSGNISDSSSIVSRHHDLERQRSQCQPAFWRHRQFRRGIHRSYLRQTRLKREPC